MKTYQGAGGGKRRDVPVARRNPVEFQLVRSQDATHDNSCVQQLHVAASGRGSCRHSGQMSHCGLCIYFSFVPRQRTCRQEQRVKGFLKHADSYPTREERKKKKKQHGRFIRPHRGPTLLSDTGNAVRVLVSGCTVGHSSSRGVARRARPAAFAASFYFDTLSKRATIYYPAQSIPLHSRCFVTASYRENCREILIN